VIWLDSELVSIFPTFTFRGGLELFLNHGEEYLRSTMSWVRATTLSIRSKTPTIVSRTKVAVFCMSRRVSRIYCIAFPVDGITKRVNITYQAVENWKTLHLQVHAGILEIQI
jgi:hypothetical protein